MSPRTLSVLRVLVVVAIVGIVVMAGSLVQFLLSGGPADTPRTSAERAILSAEEAVRANPDDPVARVRLAAAYLEQGSAGQAIEQGQIALRIEPEDPSAYFVLGAAYAAQGERDLAIQHLTTASQTEGQFAPFYQEVLIVLARVQEENGDRDTALESLEAALAYGPENASLLVERAQMLERAELWYESAYDYAWAVQYVPTYEEALEGLARLERDHPEEYQEAVDLVEQQVVGHIRPPGSE